MVLLGHAAAVAGQFLLLVFTAAGWGYWFARLTRLRAPLYSEELVLCALAGLCAGWLILQNLIYLDVRMRYGAILGALAAALGCWRLLRAETHHRTAAASAWLMPLTLLIAVFGFQARGLICQGPAHYYGYGTQDQVNYVQLAEFFIEKPYSMTLDEIGPHPWLVKAIDTKTERVGEAVANAYLAALSGTDAESAYGTTCVFLVSLTALAVFALLRSLGIPNLIAWLGGAWAGALPALTQIHLDGFFSQAATFFILPAVAAALLIARWRYACGATAAVLLLGFLFSAYTELYVLVWAAAIVMAVVTPLPPSRRATMALACTLGPLLLLPSYCRHAIDFIQGQYSAASDPLHLAEWMPRAGTWRGWSEVFLIAPKAQPLLIHSVTAIGILLLVLAALGLLLAPPNARRLWLIAFALVPAGALLALLFRRPFSPYPFGKLCATFAPVTVTLATLGIAGLASRLRHHATALAATGIAALVLLAGWASLTKLNVVVAGGAGLRSVAFPQVRATYADLQSHPTRRYWLTEHHYIINSWLCYYARAAEVYTPLPQIGDRQMPASFPFRRPPPHDGKPLWEVSAWGVQRRP